MKSNPDDEELDYVVNKRRLIGEQIKSYVGGMHELMKEWKVNTLNAKDTKLLHAKLTDLYKHVRGEYFYLQSFRRRYFEF